MERRQIADTSLYVSPVALGCWPLTGMTSPGVTEADSRATVAAALDLGINFFDTAFAYGAAGESERYIAEVIAERRDEYVIATKAGLHWKDGKQQRDARPDTIRREVAESLRRLKSDRVEILYLHAPDRSTPIEETAATFRHLQEQGAAIAIGVSNLTLSETIEFHQVCPIQIIQPPYNMLFRGAEVDLIPWCRENNVAVACYWPLMKGLLAGKMTLDQKFESFDSRPKYPCFRGEEYAKNLELVEKLRAMAERIGKTVSQLVIRWTIDQPGVTAALCGAKRVDQLEENAGALDWELSLAEEAEIALLLRDRGMPYVVATE
ncbi:aldo/keto reductase [Blastopirellula sp. JC732]|uniref:Aldo/keto reductase n=1 Tax=Blastopirellula sediminis TaxID=2894196 RepID=A0A9X1SGU1_9BACT|nr:aldo/keto reductase [Blastopirellula sediminis]MCC9607641.1 aldo/keto reductase [Blastopirellula sediminis]MCC9629066.1 aldo/keto reductase [Blastopirellula sediminis]